MSERQPDGADEPAESGLVDHLRAAIRQNVARRADYAQRGGWRAWGLSVVLVAHERSLLPFAALLDRRAAPFQREGIPILAADLQPMALSPPPGRQLEGVGPMPSGALREVRLRVGGRQPAPAPRAASSTSARPPMRWRPRSMPWRRRRRAPAPGSR